ncbi:MAG TPA: bifunctional phosphopantothenoylcysteine decarboxylase/phosphopantothenate--cysteine ligase CoaBC [Chitinophagaceae bacterium]|nr:bifunctional phosphopantothenoylcysteine decarboxylase/phosphopantothenate--cysteine ligase CoaBC [Chitinophagaceae bacterium]
MLAQKKILIGITGSIAAYKIPLLVRGLQKEGAEVKLVMTPAAADFVSKLTLSTLSKAPVQSQLFDEEGWANHVQLGRWADVFLIAPLSCNTASKMANGQCDNLVLATYLSATCPVVVAPAMDEDMWHHPATKENMQRLAKHGCRIIPVEYGELASGLVGDGRMAEPQTMIGYLRNFFKAPSHLAGKKVLVTAGPTYEAIDPVRFIGNHSSGKMGYAIAEALAQQGAAVTLVSGPVVLQAKNKNIQVVPVTTASEMYKACMAHSDYDLAVMAAAVADFTPETAATQKIKKGAGGLTIELKKTTDILAALGAQKKEGQVLAGFALETENEVENALKKLHSKGADLIILNSLNDAGAGFGGDTNKITILNSNGVLKKWEAKPKTEVANDIVATLIELIA